jgi:molybdate transport system regulatory protein
MARLNIKVELGDGRALGPGKIRLLELIDEKGSIRRAAVAMEMSYRRAWLLLHDVEDMMGAPVLAAETGGHKGGGTSLTAAGRAVVDHYRSIEAIAARSIGTELKALARLAKRSSAGVAKPKPNRPPIRKS